LGGLVFGIGTALIAETLDPRFTAPTQISDVLGVPVLRILVNQMQKLTNMVLPVKNIGTLPREVRDKQGALTKHTFRL